ncbi:DUF427 domain-containing protein [Pseudonocardia spinosispora]|uniref:DUF427 domain-containing protein n=1 Tax=Pseudonocardia spinosispora TaxID=103441 RepID=UPI0004280569|nr:DUF427 domain-containing protein [Pseudonocardia spinosispora]
MTLTRLPGPLAGTDDLLTNYRIDGPKHRLLMQPFPRRVRAEFAGETVLDTRDGVLVHETGLLPQLYVPEADLRTDLLEATDLHTHCPFKGDASYRSIRVGDRVAENAVWHYPEPISSASWLSGYAALYWSAPDRWLDEDDEAVGHLPDPFHRVDIRATSSRVRVLAGDVVVADSTRALLLSETGLPNRYYLPAEDVREELLVPTETRTVCPYKGWASYWSLRTGDTEIADVAWGYQEPLDESARLRGYRSFLHDELTTEVS